MQLQVVIGIFLLLWFQVSVDNTQVVEMIQCQGKFGQIEFDIFFREHYLDRKSEAGINCRMMISTMAILELCCSNTSIYKTADE